MKSRKKSTPEEKRNKRYGVMKFFRRVLIAAVVLSALALGGMRAWGELTDMSRFDVTFYELMDEKITSPVRIAFLSDLHLHEFGKDNADLVSAVRELSPDMILVGGDMNIAGNPDYSKVLTLMEQLTPICEVYYAVGNHEYEDLLFQGSKQMDDVSALGVTVLKNWYVTVTVNGNVLDIGGLNEMSNHFEQYSQKFYKLFMQSENYRILLAHDPAYFDKGGALVGADIDLALCGHRHGGQVIIPFMGGLYHPGNGLFPNMTDGAHDIDGTWVVVSRGLGNSGNIPRVNNPPELVVIDLY